MQTLHHPYDTTYVPARSKTAIFSKFFTWCRQQEEYRFGWVAAILTIHGCVLAPLTIFVSFLVGFNIVLIALVIGAMAMALVSNLAAMPTKITIPVFFFSVLVDLAVIIASIAMYLLG